MTCSSINIKDSGLNTVTCRKRSEHHTAWLSHFGFGAHSLSSGDIYPGGVCLKLKTLKARLHSPRMKISSFMVASPCSKMVSLALAHIVLVWVTCSPEYVYPKLKTCACKLGNPSHYTERSWHWKNLSVLVPEATHQTDVPDSRQKKLECNATGCCTSMSQALTAYHRISPKLPPIPPKHAVEDRFKKKSTSESMAPWSDHSSDPQWVAALLQ